MSEQVIAELENRVAEIKQTISRLQTQSSKAEHKDTLTLLKANTEDIGSILAKQIPGERFDDIAKEIESQLTETQQFLDEIGIKGKAGE